MTKVTDSQLAQYHRFMHDINGRVLKGSLDPTDVMNMIRPLIGQKGSRVIEPPKLITETPYLRLISGGQDLVISACTGGPRASLVFADKTFTGYVADFKNRKLDTKQPATEATPVLVYEMWNQDGTFEQIYNLLSTDTKALAFQSQEQVERFAIEHRSWLRTNGNATFFLFTEMVDKKEQFFVAYVAIDGDHLRVGVFRFSRSCVWSAGGQHRFVFPATGLLVA